MNDSSGKTSSSLAIVEKRPQKPSGCAGIFFHLFDWNRRLAKKKLFSKKLLAPARAKRVSKKFGRDEKMPTGKLLLIADENRGGFPTGKKSEVESIDSERNNDMQPPGLIARLMGLESMPAVHREKPKIASVSDVNHNPGKKCTNNLNCGTSELFGCDQEKLNVGKGQMKVEPRPQKLQKIGLFERRSVTRFGAEAMQFKSVLSRSKKHNQKLPSPVKSPRRLSGRNAARFVEAAATKILEPGLQATNRAKCALTYSPSLRVPPKNEVMMERTSVISLDQSELSSYHASAAKSLKGQSPCKSCGNLVDVDFRSNVEEQTPGFPSVASEFVKAPPQGSGRSKPKPTRYSLEQERDAIGLQNQDQPISIAVQAKVNVHTRREKIMDGKPPFREDQVQHGVSSQRCKSQKDVPSSTALQQRIQRQNQMLVAKDKILPRPKLSNVQGKRHVSIGNAVNRPKNFVTLNRNSSSLTRMRMSPKVLDDLKADMGRNACEKQDDYSSRLRVPVPKRRPMNGGGQTERTGSGSSIFGKPKNIRGNVINGKRMVFNACSVNQTHVKNGLSNEAEGNIASSNEDNNIVSFMFSSPMRHSTGSSSPAEMEEKRRGRDELMSCSTSQPENLLLDANNGNPSSQMPIPLRGDTLGALLEQKLREIACQDRDELSMPGGSTASILEELISSLTAGRPISHEVGDNSSVGFHEENSSCCITPDPFDRLPTHDQMFNSNRKLQAKAKAVRGSVGVPFFVDGDHPSPGSVLEASFSNDSCFSGSLDGGSGHKMYPEPMGCFYDQSQPSGADVNLLDSAASFNTGMAGSKMLTNSINTISMISDSIELDDIGLMGMKLNHAREVILNAELLFGNAAPNDANGMEGFLVGPVLDKLEIFADTFCRSFDSRRAFMEAKEGFQLRRFLFDCMIECLDLKYVPYCKSGFKTWIKLPLHMSAEFLMREVYGEIRRWTDLAGKIPDEIIEREMSHSLGKWMDFEIEAFETAIEIEQDILQLLTDEMVFDLCQCRGGSS